MGFFKTRYSAHHRRHDGKSSGPSHLGSRIASCASSLWQSTKNLLNRTSTRTFVAPLLSVFIGILLVSIAFSDLGKTYHDTDKDCKTNLDADISGDGVRASIWVQIGVLILISAMGRFHPCDTGIKEVTGGLILTHASLVIALVVQMCRGTLTSVDAAIGAAILDAQNVALQIPLSNKETLAARWQVILVIPTQIMGLIVLPFLVAGLERGDFV
jgi:hypothetical protein